MDTLPAQKQEIGNAWASRMVAGGHLIGYTMYLSLPLSPRILKIRWLIWQGLCEFDESVVFLGRYAIEGYMLSICCGIVYYGWYYMLLCL